VRRLHVFFTLLIGILLLAPGCRGPVEPHQISFQGATIVVWDAKEPHLPGATPFSELVAQAVEVFAKENAAKIEVLFKSRSEIESLLTGTYQGEKPALVYSTEWPFLGSGMQDLTGVMPDDEYQDASMAYWTDDGKIMGIPSYVHWLCLASKLPESEEFKDRAGYFLASPGFLDSGLAGLDGGWAVQNVLDYVEWVGSNFGRYVEEPLDRWAQNQSVALFPVTPHMLKWLRLSEEGSSVAMLPIPGPNGQSGFYFTVPGYAVMATDETEFTCAFELGKILARTRGRWAARAIGGIPCFIQDVPVYHLESGFSREERLDLIAEFEKSGSRILRLDEFLMRGEIRPGITSLIERYLSGQLNKEQLEEGIRSRMRGYTNH
jgi:hypothetical protein